MTWHWSHLKRSVRLIAYKSLKPALVRHAPKYWFSLGIIFKSNLLNKENGMN